MYYTNVFLSNTSSPCCFFVLPSVTVYESPIPCLLHFPYMNIVYTFVLMFSHMTFLFDCDGERYLQNYNINEKDVYFTYSPWHHVPYMPVIE